MTSPIEYLGTSPLFLGVETAIWSLAQFQTAARTAKTLGITALLVKIADGGNVWYANSGGWQKVLDTVKAEGIHALPYTYCYGNKFGAIQSEINILIAAMHYSGVVVADMEAEYNGQVSWAQTVCTALKPVSGVFGVTTWADPQLQNWHGVLSALAPCVNFWLPQVYSNYLASVYHAQFDPYGLPYYPVLNLGTDAGPNDILAIARQANSPIIGYWEYTAIGAYASIVKGAMAHITTPAPPVPPASMDALTRYNTNGHLKQELDDCWKSLQPTLPTGSGIWKSWLSLWLDKGIHAGPPLKGEYSSIDGNGAAIKVLECAHLRCEWHADSTAHWYGASGAV